MKGLESVRPGLATVSCDDEGDTALPSTALPEGGGFPLVARKHYAIGEEIARGGRGRLLRARDLRLDRVVAIKEPLAFSTQIERRFFREAVLTARLQHPSIVPVHEIGRWDTGEPFYAMKLVSGRSLREAVAETTTMEQRVALVPNVLAVADAIAYAHDQGVIHRDLKPSNVMVGAFGETQVIDWGLAKEVRGPEEHVESLPLEEPADQTHGVHGTPSTMAPEQAAGTPVDERTDVYGIGALLYEVLAGSPPYVGVSAAAVIAEVAAHPPPPLAARAPRAPRDLVAIVEHAMARDPANRYPSARELADDLRRFSNGQLVRAHRYSPWLRIRRFAKQNRRTLIAVAASLSLGTAGALTVARARGTGAPVCQGADRKLAGVWSSERKGAIGRALLAGGKPWAGETAKLVVDELDRYGREWVAVHREACEATSVRHEQSEALLDLRMQCLDERLEEVRALTTLLSEPNDTLLASAPKAVYAVTPIRGCTDAKALLAPVPLPADPTTRADVDKVRSELANVRAMNELGRYAETQPLSAELATHAQSLRYAPIEAEALEVRGDSLEYVGDYQHAGAAYREALYAAERGLDRARAASAMINLVWGVGVDQGQHEQAHEYATQAAAILVGLGGDVELEANLASYESSVLRDEGRLAEAEKQGREAIAKRKIAFGPMHPRYAMALANVAAEIADQGRYAEALELGREAMIINARTLGEHHPDYALSLQSVASSLNKLGRRSEARPLIERALAVLEESFGTEHSRVANAEWSAGLIYMDLGDLALAEGHLRHAVSVAVQVLGADHVYAAVYGCALADVLVKEQRNAEAVVQYRRALAIVTKGNNAQVMSEVQSGLGVALLALGQPADALAMLEPALKWKEEKDPVAKPLASTRLRVAQALWLTGGDRMRARRLAALAVQAYAADPNAAAEMREATDWLEAHGGPIGRDP